MVILFVDAAGAHLEASEEPVILSTHINAAWFLLRTFWLIGNPKAMVMSYPCIKIGLDEGNEVFFKLPSLQLSEIVWTNITANNMQSLILDCQYRIKQF